MKSAPSTLLTDIAKRVTTFATLISLTRDDGVTLHFTQHDVAITFDGIKYRNDIPYNLSALDTNSDLSVDSTTLEVAIDGTVFTHSDIANDLYRGGQIQIALVNWANLSSGKMILREGWFTQLQDNRPNIMSLEIGGLMKVLDMGIGRIYQPGCDADFGDARCRVALDPSQGYSALNPIINGDWAYVYDRTLLTALTTGTNLGFEAGNLTGWTQSPNAVWAVIAASPPPIEGTYELAGDPAGAQVPSEQFVYQDFALTDFDNTDTDAGKIAFLLFYKVKQLNDTVSTYPRSLIEVYDADGTVIQSKDSRYLTMDTKDSWREQCAHLNLKPGARTVRVYLYAKTKSGPSAAVAFDEVQPYGYNWLTTQPDHELIFKALRTPDLDGGAYDYAFANSSFEVSLTPITPSATEDMVGWVKGGSFWGTASLFGGTQGPASGTFFALAGDNASGIQTTYELTQVITLNASWVDLARVALGKYVGRFLGTGYWGDTGSAAGVVLDFLAADLTTVISSASVLPDTTKATGIPVKAPFVGGFTMPAGTAGVKIHMRAVSPPGASAALIAFDGLRLQLLDPERANRDIDLSKGFGDPATAFDYTAGNYTEDGHVVWRAFPTNRLEDVVATAIDRKTFTGTDVVGDFGAYETGKIEWLSGDNAGRMSIVRTWFPGDKQLKVYFPVLHDIQIGDRFAYYPGCQKRFAEDCIFRFNNAINFQGFPYLPGQVTPGNTIDATNAPPVLATPPLQLTNPRKFADNSSTLTYPTGADAPLVGDMLTVCAWNESSTAVPQPPAGWYSASGAAQGAGIACAAFCKIVTAQDVADGAVIVANATWVVGMFETPSAPLASVFSGAPITEHGVGAGTDVLSLFLAGPNSTVASGQPQPGSKVFMQGAAGSGTLTLDTSTLLSLPVVGTSTPKIPNAMSTAIANRQVDQTYLKVCVVPVSLQDVAYGIKRGSSGGNDVLVFGLAFGALAATPAS